MDWQGISLVLAQDAEPGPSVDEQQPGVPPEAVEGQPSEGDVPLGATDGDAGGGGGLFGGGTSLLLPLALVFVVMWIFLLGGNRKERKKHEQMLADLSKGDRVQTAGGILGSVVEVRGDEVVVKVDENANTRLRFARSAIKGVVSDESADEKSK